jgi:pimeloyl-ACP methyl ester carboxylesterase
MIETEIFKVETSHGIMAVEATSSAGPDVVLIHGNSSCRAVFHKQVRSQIGEDYRFICLDLPGHGDSSDASDKQRTYNLPGLADATLEALELLNVQNPALLGWSLGGHVAIEMISRGAAVRGLFLTGTPPVGAEIRDGFRGNLLKGLASTGPFSREQAKQFVEGVFGGEATGELVEAAMRTDGDFRTTLFSQARSSEKSNQREVVSSVAVPTAIVNGAEDPIVNLDYIEAVPYASLWRGNCFKIPSAGHSSFLQNSVEFNSYLFDFLEDLGV